MSASAIRVKKGDTVMVRSGKFRGQTGKVVSTDAVLQKVTVEGINVTKRNRKPSRANPQGGVVEFTRPLHVSKIGIVDPTSKKPTRIGYKVTKGGEKVRIYKKSGKEITS